MQSSPGLRLARDDRHSLVAIAEARIRLATESKGIVRLLGAGTAEIGRLRQRPGRLLAPYELSGQQAPSRTLVGVGAAPGFMPKRDSVVIGDSDPTTDGTARPEIGDRCRSYVNALSLFAGSD